MKVYVVTAGSYSDYRIKGIFTTKELAEGYIKMFKDGLYSDFNDVDEWDLDDFKTEIEQGYICYEVQMKRNGDVVKVNKSDNYWSIIGYVDKDSRFYGNVLAKDEQHAIKIFNERRIQYIQINNI